MNTDNVSIAGETIDYGPCAFLDAYANNAVFSSIDAHGRYAFGNQASTCSWNLVRFAEAIGGAVIEDDPEGGEEKMIALLKGFGQRFLDAWLEGMRVKLGLTGERDDDLDLANALFAAMEGQEVDFTLFFRNLSQSLVDGEEVVRAMFDDPDALTGWLVRWHARIADDSLAPAERARAMDAVNPLYIPRNHKVEEALAAAVAGDLAPFEKLVEVVTHPFEPREGLEDYAVPAPESFGRYVTFCGT